MCYVRFICMGIRTKKNYKSDTTVTERNSMQNDFKVVEFTDSNFLWLKFHGKIIKHRKNFYACTRV